DWCELTLEESMDAIIDYRGKTPKKTDSGIPLITAKIIKRGRIETVNEFISEDDYDTWMRRGIPNEGDVVMTTEAPLGEIAQLDGRKIALAQRVITLRGKKDILDNTFLKYLMISEYVQHQLDGRGTGTTVKGIKQSELRKVVLKFPSFKEQKAIAHILGSLDDKIELNRQMNETLEAMAQALFKSWFVDFDPVIDNALAAGNAIPDEFIERAEQRKAIEKKDHSDIQGLFPDEFEFTEEMGWIPKGWVVESFGDVSICFDRLRVPLSKKQREDKKPGVIPYHGATSVMDYINEWIFDDIYLLIGEDGSVIKEDGSPFVQYIWGKTWVNNHAHVLQGKNGVGTEHLMLFMQSQNLTAYITGAVQLKINQGNMNRIPFLNSGSKINERFTAIINPFYEKLRSTAEENETLSKLRDTLLPKLMSGELRISDTL
ncbi:restriction endonuclease subunit S, partial [Psychrobacter sp. T6-1]